MKSNEIIVKGIKISYLEQGLDENSEIFVFLHGWGSNKESFNQIYEHEKHSGILAIDLPGFGNSDKLKKAWTLKDFAKTVEEIINKKIPNKKLILVGHSFSGRVILKLIQMHSNILSNYKMLIFIGVPFFRDSGGKAILTKRKLVIYGAKIFHVCLSMPPLSFWSERLRTILRSTIGATNFIEIGDDEIMKKTFFNVITEDIPTVLENIDRTKAHIIHSKNDIAVHFHTAKKASKLSGVELHMIEGTSHNPFVNKLIDFFKIWDKIK